MSNLPVKTSNQDTVEGYIYYTCVVETSAPTVDVYEYMPVAIIDEPERSQALLFVDGNCKGKWRDIRPLQVYAFNGSILKIWVPKEKPVRN